MAKSARQIKLTLKRGDDGKPFDITLTREEIKIKIGKVGREGPHWLYIRITSFNEQTQPGVEAAIKDIQAKIGNKIQGYVLDLRNNPGGLLDQAVDVGSDFLDSRRSRIDAWAASLTMCSATMPRAAAT